MAARNPVVVDVGPVKARFRVVSAPVGSAAGSRERGRVVLGRAPAETGHRQLIWPLTRHRLKCRPRLRRRGAVAAADKAGQVVVAEVDKEDQVGLVTVSGLSLIHI